MSRAIAILFITCFFSALPLWFLSGLGQDGWVTFHGTPGTPYQCTVTKWNLLKHSTATYAPKQFSRGEKESTYKGRSMWESTLWIDGVEVLSRPSRTKVDIAVSQLQSALLDQKAIDREFEPTVFFWFSVGLVALFAAAGLFIGIFGGQRVAVKELAKPKKAQRAG